LRECTFCIYFHFFFVLDGPFLITLLYCWSMFSLDTSEVVLDIIPLIFIQVMVMMSTSLYDAKNSFTFASANCVFSRSCNIEVYIPLCKNTIFLLLVNLCIDFLSYENQCVWIFTTMHALFSGVDLERKERIWLMCLD